jgi:hypothetical protein
MNKPTKNNLSTASRVAGPMSGRPQYHDSRLSTGRYRGPEGGVLALLLMIGTSVAGCRNSPPPVASADQAQEALHTALEAWKKGQTAESLKASMPKIYVNDPDWRSEKELVKYEMGQGQAHGNSWHCDVILTLQDKSGTASEKHVGYLIDTDPELVVIRDIGAD